MLAHFAPPLSRRARRGLELAWNAGSRLWCIRLASRCRNRQGDPGRESGPNEVQTDGPWVVFWRTSLGARWQKSGVRCRCAGGRPSDLTSQVDGVLRSGQREDIPSSRGDSPWRVLFDELAGYLREPRRHPGQNEELLVKVLAPEPKKLCASSEGVGRHGSRLVAQYRPSHRGAARWRRIRAATSAALIVLVGLRFGHRGHGRPEF